MPGRPLRDVDGTPVFLFPKSAFQQNEEQRLCIWLASQSVLFGHCYRSLMPAFFEKLGLDSGLMIATAVPSRDLLPAMSSPGDVDLLVIPYRKNYLLIDQTLAIEVKIVRARFEAQDRSPNDFGFSQAKGLLRHGFPFVAVAHLIVSDRSPPMAWKSMFIADVLNADSGRISGFREFFVDMMPADLMRRSYGRMLQHCSSDRIGLLAAYAGNQGTWFPIGMAAKKNLEVNRDTLNAIADYYGENFWRFRDLPRYPVA